MGHIANGCFLRICCCNFPFLQTIQTQYNTFTPQYIKHVIYLRIELILISTFVSYEMLRAPTMFLSFPLFTSRNRSIHVSFVITTHLNLIKDYMMAFECV